MTAGPPPGIYQDPTDPDRQRYWDGASWGQKLPSPGDTTYPPSAASASPTSALRPSLPSADYPSPPTPEASYGAWGAGSWQPAETHSLPGAVRACFAKYATFSGRASRSEFWWFFLFGQGLGFLVGVLFELTSALMVHAIGLLIILSTLPPAVAVSWRRMHDSNRSGWWNLLAVPAALAATILFSILSYLPIDAAAGVWLLAAGALQVIGVTVVLASIAYPLYLLARKGNPAPNRFG